MILQSYFVSAALLFSTCLRTRMSLDPYHSEHPLAVVVIILRRQGSVNTVNSGPVPGDEVRKAVHYAVAVNLHVVRSTEDMRYQATVDVLGGDCIEAAVFTHVRHAGVNRLWCAWRGGGGGRCG